MGSFCKVWLGWKLWSISCFTESERWFKIQEGTFKAGFSATGNRDGEISAVKVIVPQGSTWVIENSNQFSDITEIIVENGGKIEIAKMGV